MTHVTNTGEVRDLETAGRRASWCFVVAIAGVAFGRGPRASADVGASMGGGGPPPTAPCMTDLEREQIQQAITEWRSSRPDSTLSEALGVPPKFTFYPLGGTLYGDVFSNNFVDLDPGFGSILDWDCTANTYDGHDATDVLLRSFGEQAIGVPVFAALDGTVVDAHDGELDMHTACSGIANYVVLQHAGGRTTSYLHFKRNSVQVSVSQVVRAGEQLGLAASSGCSDWPHLHFATYDNFFSTLVEPYAGPCRPGESEWVDQTAMNHALYVRDLNITTGTPNLPFDAPRTGTFVTGVRNIRFWIMTGNFPADSGYRFRFFKPDSSMGFDSGLGGFGNPYYGFSWWWWSLAINLDQLGTWHIEMELNGTLLASAPFDVVSNASQIVNRPPHPITVQIEPSVPTEDDVLICRVNTDLILDDPDYDIVRYHYVWQVDGGTVRDVVTAGHADVIPHHTATPGAVVTCTVTPGDGSANGPPAQATTTLDGPPVAWNSNPASATRATRTLTMFVRPEVTATPGSTALQIEMVDLQHPNPRNRPANPPPNFTAFDTTNNGTCSGATASPNYNGHHCDANDDCIGPDNGTLLDDGTCLGLLGCGVTDGCLRWVGPVTAFREKQGVLTLGTYKAARLQCTPYYTDWPTVGPFSVFGPEIIPSSTYRVRSFASDCKNIEPICTSVSEPMTMTTRRSGDVAAPWNPPDTGDQPTGGDVGEVLNKFKGSPGSPSNIAALIFGNAPDPNTDVGGQEIGETVNAFKGQAYPFSGPCACPSTVMCGATACSSTDSAPCGAGLCVITCVGGDNAGLPCRDFPPNAPADHCPGGTCPTAGFCRDRCGRCN